MTGGELLSLLDDDEGWETPAKRRNTASPGRKYCPHCKQLVNAKTFWRHKKLYFNEVTIAGGRKLSRGST